MAVRPTAGATLHAGAARRRVRLVFGAICGLLASWSLSNAIQVAAEYYHAAEAPFDYWGVALWGEHWRLRGLASLAAAVWGGFIAGLVARRRGALVAVLGATPASVMWGVSAILAWPVGDGFPLANRLLPVVLSIAVPFAAYKCGPLGATLGTSLAQHFDTRPRTLLGIPWFHHLWIPLPLNIIVIQSSWAVIYAADWVWATFAAGKGIFSFVPGLFLMAIVGTLQLTYRGLSRAYRALAGFDSVASGKWRAVLKHGLGMPLLAMVLQAAIGGLHYLLTTILR